MGASTVETALSGPATRAPAGQGAGQDHADRGRLNLSWLIQLHWWAIVGQAVVVVGAASWTGIGLPYGTLLGLLALEIVGNVVLGEWARRGRVTHGAIAAVMLLDAAALTVLLDLTGGASNPFSTLYLVNVALAAILLPPGWSWLLMGASFAGFASLFIHEALTSPAHHVHLHMDPAQLMVAHLNGMWISFALAAIFIVFFGQRVSRALAAREQELQHARALGERREKLASLATLAAGAAHELSTPLSTIAVVAKELQRALPDDASPEMRQDLTLVRDQVARCREILDRMSVRAGENVGESLAGFTVRRWVESALGNLPSHERVTVEAEPGAEDARIAGPPRALGDALRGLLKNALQASGDGAPVTLKLSVADGRVSAAVLDRGLGMSADVLSRVGEPFFTTKSPGEGMGLGLFLTRALAEQLGGEFHIASVPDSGTEARIELPAIAGERSTT
jgi:two-component system, sensor histidine kinase RegB